MKLIDTLKQEIDSLAIRILPLNTINLLSLNFYDSCERLAGKCMESLDRQGFILTVSKEELKQLLLRDILSSDVPYLTEFQTMLYCGMPYQKNVIGRKKDV